MKTWQKLLGLLSDGRFHSGQALAEELNISRTTVWKQLKALEAQLGLTIHSVKGRGYRLSQAIELLDNVLIQGHLSAYGCDLAPVVHISTITTSTNDLAAASALNIINAPEVWLAEYQTSGRGRRGREWVSTFGTNLYLSLAWKFDKPLSELSGVSLGAGVALAKTLSELGVHGHGLKWPNDVLLNGNKLAGILVEASGESEGPSTAIVGIGVNLAMSEKDASSITQPWIALDSVMEQRLSRNQFAGKLIANLLLACQQYSMNGIDSVVDEWADYDLYRDQSVMITSGANIVHGKSRGLSPDGGLLVENSAGIKPYYAGEVSLRLNNA